MQVTEKGGALILPDIKTDIGLLLFWIRFLKVQKKELLSSGRKEKEKMIHTFLETEEIGTQQETILKCKSMQNCSGDEVSHSS